MIDWNLIRDGSVATAGIIVAIHTLTRKGKADALAIAIGEATAYKLRNETLEAERKQDREEMIGLRAQVSELTGKVNTYESLIGGKEVSPAIKALIDALAKTLTDCFSTLTDQMEDHSTKLEAIQKNTNTATPKRRVRASDKQP